MWCGFNVLFGDASLESVKKSGLYLCIATVTSIHGVGRPKMHRREDFVRVALQIVDAGGLEALTFRRLGREIGASATAAYSHFENREQLISALVNELLKEAVSSISLTGGTPHEKLMQVAGSIRQMFLRHPYWVATFLRVSNDAEDAARAFRVVVSLLEEAGLSGEKLVVAYRILEGYMFGVTAYDLGRAPDHHDVRRRRYQRTGHQAFKKFASSERAVSAHTEEAFMTGLDHLLTSFGV